MRLVMLPNTRKRRNQRRKRTRRQRAGYYNDWVQFLEDRNTQNPNNPLLRTYKQNFNYRTLQAEMSDQRRDDLNGHFYMVIEKNDPNNRDTHLQIDLENNTSYSYYPNRLTGHFSPNNIPMAAKKFMLEAWKDFRDGMPGPTVVHDIIVPYQQNSR